MKLMLVALLAMGVAGATAGVPAVARNEDCLLQQNIRHLLSFINTDGMAEVLAGSLDNPDVQDLLYYILGPEFRALYLSAAAQPEVQALFVWLEQENHCVDVRSVLNAIRDFLELPPVDWRREGAVRAQRNGVADLVDQLLAQIDVQRIHEEALILIETSPPFAEFLELIRSDDAIRMVGELQANDTFQYMVGALRGYGIDTDAFLVVIRAILGLN